MKSEKKMLNFSLVLCFLLGAFITAPPLSAEVFKYVDANGSTHYVTNEESIPPQFKDQVKGSAPLPPINKVPSVEYPDRIAASGNRVEILVADWCSHCRRLEKYLKKNAISFIRHDIDRSAKGRLLYQQLGGGGIPIIRVDGKRILRGFSPAALQAALK